MASPPRRVDELILSGADVNVLNHTTLSLWHFRELALQMLPPAASAAEPEDEDKAKKSDTSHDLPAPHRRAIELGEGMNVAAVLYDRTSPEKAGSPAEKDAQETPGDQVDTYNGTENSRPSGQVQGVTTNIPGQMTVDTRVTAVFQRYRCVICLDASPSILSIDPASGRLFLDLLNESVELFIWSMLRPMEVGGVAFTPELHVSVLVQGALVESLCVLMQGYIVTPSNAAGFLQLIKERIQLIENDWATRAQELGQWGYLGNATPASLDWVLQNAVFALHSLPTDCAPMMVLVTDGVMDIKDAFSYDNMLMQLVRHDIQCHFLRIGGGGEDELDATFGFVPDTRMLRFVADSTGGSVFDYAAIFEACYGSTSTCSNSIKKMTGLQDACFVRKSNVHANSAPVIKLNEMDSTSFDGRTLLPLRPYRMWRQKVHEYRIFADVSRIVEARLCEGFVINKVYIKTLEKPLFGEGDTIGLNTDTRGNITGNNSTTVNSTNSSGGAVINRRPNEVTKILIVFLLQWKQNVWLEYVVSTTMDSSTTPAASASAAAHTGRRSNAQGAKGSASSSSTRKSASFFSKDQRTTWREWYVKMNILAYADFLRAFEDTAHPSTGDRNTNASTRENIPMGSPIRVHDFIRNVQDVDRVLLHLMTATASISEASESVANQFSFGTSGSASSSTSSTPKITSSHPVFNIIGELSTVLWHRWFFVDRFEILSVVKSGACTDLFYQNEVHDMMDRGNAVSHLRGGGSSSQGMIHSHSSNVYGTSSGSASIGVESLAEPLVAILVKWSSQKLSQDLFLKFLCTPTAEKTIAPPRAKASSSSSSTPTGGIALRRRQRSQNSSGGEDTSHAGDSGSTRESKAALCFVRLEVKNKTLCAVHVAFFATRASTRRQVLHDLKNTIFTSINEVAVTPIPAKLLSSPPTETPVILCHRMLSRLLVTHDTLLLHGLDQEPGPFDYYVASPSLEAEKNAGDISPSSVCCGGNELQLQRVFGAYVWHSSWKWEVANLSALLDVMRRLHNARISCGFWVLDWKMGEVDDGQGPHVESVIFGREILMEDEKGHTKTALVQYALRRVSDTCLMTSFWMEPQHGIVKTRLSDEADHSDRFHWSLKQAIGHSTPFEAFGNRGAHRSSQNTHSRENSDRTASTPTVEDEQKSMEQEDVSIDWNGKSTYMGESELLHLIRGYLFKSDRHFLSCLYTFDCIVNLRENIELLSQLSKGVEGVVGSNWNMDRQLAAENGMILPPFSTARLLATSQRSTEHFLMYLENSRGPTLEKGGQTNDNITSGVSPANENLYSMLERTLRGLSDCEVSWTDYNGDVVATGGVSTNNGVEDDRFFREGMDGQLPLWLKNHLAISFKDRVPHHALSKGKCFAKLVSDDCVVLAFFPSLEALQVQDKTPDNFKAGEDIDENSFGSRLRAFSKPCEKEESGTTTSQQFSARAAEEDGGKSRTVRMSVSADDIVLYQERRRSFREGYKSWRMGHTKGSRDEKKSYGRDFQKLRLPSTPEDHEFCEEVSRRALYGCDFHLLIKNTNGVFGSGFFQVAFYECSLSRLSTDLHDQSDQMLGRVDLPHTILKQLFFSNLSGEVQGGRPAIPLDRGGLWKRSPSRSSLESTGTSQSRQSSDSIIASRRFRKKVKRAHEHNFSRGVYIALREGGAVEHSDLLQALSSCIEIPVDVDITLLYRMMEAAAASTHKLTPLSPAAAAVVSAGIGADILKEKLTKSFEAILASVFVPIAGTKYYYFTGNENAVLEDMSAAEYDLHVLMEDSDDGEAESMPNEKGVELTSGSKATSEEDPKSLRSRSVGDDDRVNAHSLSVKSTELGSELVADEGDARGARASRRRGSLGREVPPSVVTSGDENSGGEQPHANMEEDAEFNKEVAVATSSFSVPFFFRFECRVLSSSTRETRASSADLHTPGVVPDSELLRRSASTAAYDDMRKDMVAQAQLTSPSTRHKEFNAFLTSLRNGGHGILNTSNVADVTHIADSFTKVSSGRIALRLVTLTLPNERAFDDAQLSPLMPFDMDNAANQPDKNYALPTLRPNNLSTLHLFQRQVLTRVKKDIKEWSSVEILSVLKSSNEITPATGAMVQRLFDDLPAESVTKAKYPLEFVARSQETPVNPLDLFKRELEKGDLLNVHRCNNVYFVVGTKAFVKKSPGDGELVTKSVPEVDTAHSEFDIPYWAFFELEGSSISLRMHHPARFSTSPDGFNRLGVLTKLQLGVRAVCRRVNQYLLLLQLHETRTCNGLLLPPNGDLPSSPRSPKRRSGSQGSTSGKDGLTKQSTFFWPGQFECDLRYSAFFKLHERLAPNFALNMLCTSALEQFQVHNRRHIFVYRDRDGHVFYMKISIYYENAQSSSSKFAGQLTEERQDRGGLTRSGSGGGAVSVATVTAPVGVPGILLEVFGVSEAGEEVTHELCRLLERKLDEATQVVLMKLLARNTKFQLSPPDLAFLSPPATHPASMVDYVLPQEAADYSTLLHYLSQTVKLAPYIRSIASCGPIPPRNMRDPENSSFRGVRRGSLASAGSTVSSASLPGEDVLKSADEAKEDDNAHRQTNTMEAVHDSALLHPACFGDYRKATAQHHRASADDLLRHDATIVSPVCFSTVPRLDRGVGAHASDIGTSIGPPTLEIVAQDSYVLNLNPDLRLSPGFMSRVGKGLALMRIDIIRNWQVPTEKEDEENGDSIPDIGGPTQRIKYMRDIPGLESLYSKESSRQYSAPLVARCQVWTRGSIHVVELSHVVEAFLDEAIYDYHIEATIKGVQFSDALAVGQNDASSDSTTSREDGTETSGLSGAHGKLPSNVDTLISLFESASTLPSSSVTKLGADLPIAPWDIDNAMAQVRDFLCCLPLHLRPTVYAKSQVPDVYEIISHRDSNNLARDNFRLIMKQTGDSGAGDDVESSDSDAETTLSMSSALHHIEPLMRTDSVHSEISDIDSVSGRLPLTWMGESNMTASQKQSVPSVSSTTSSLVGLMANLPQQLHVPKNTSFSERDVLLYYKGSSSRHNQGDSNDNADSKRSFYYVVDLSTKKGLRLYGYNMSTVFMDALSSYLARLLTWCTLREQLLRGLLLEKSGLSAAAPVGCMVLQPRSLFLTIGRTERAGKSNAVLCKDSAVRFIEYCPPVVPILQSNEWFPRVLDASRLRSIDGLALGLYLREAQTQSASEVHESQFQRPRGKSNTSLGAPIGPVSIPNLSRETSGQTSSQRSLLSMGDASSHVSGTPAFGRAKGGGIVGGSSSGSLVALGSDSSTPSSPTKRLNGASSGLPYPSTNRNEAAPRMRGGTGAATALMAARARARGGGFPGRMGSGPGVSATRGNAAPASAAASGDNIAPWDLPLLNTKGPRLAASGDAADSKSTASTDSTHRGNKHSDVHTGEQTTTTTAIISKSSMNSSNPPIPRRPRNIGHSEQGLHRRGSNDPTSTDPGRIHSSWKKRLECAWGPRFLFPGSTEHWASTIVPNRRQHFLELEVEDDSTTAKKCVAPLPYFCAALEKCWEAFETRSTSHTVGLNLLGKLASLGPNEEMEEPVAKDVAAHLVMSGHLLLHQRFRAAYVERWGAAELIGATEREGDSTNSRLRAQQSCMDLVNLLSYKREFVFDRDECIVPKLYSEHTILSMGAGAGDDVLSIKEQVAANLSSLRLGVASEFFKEFAVHLRTLGFRRLRTLHTGSSSHARAYSGSHGASVPDGETLSGEGFSEYFYHPERTAAEAGGWQADLNSISSDAYPLSIVVLEVKCDHRGIRLTAVVVSLHDLEQQDLRFQSRLAAKGHRSIGASGSRVQSVAAWLRAQLQTEALIYGFTIRHFQQQLVQWVQEAHDFHANQSEHDQSASNHLNEDDALVLAPPSTWKKASTYQNIVKGLQSFLQAFPDPPVAAKKNRSTASAVASANRSSGSNAIRGAPRSAPMIANSGTNSYRPAPRSMRFPRRAAPQTAHHSMAQLSPVAAASKQTVPLSALWHDCVIHMTTVTLQGTALQSNCFEPVLVQILLRFIACHESRYDVLDLLQFGTPDTVVCHSSSGSFFHRPPSTISTPKPRRVVEPLGGYSLVITTQSLTKKPLDKDSVQLLLLKSTPSALGVGNGVLPVERALQEAQLFTRELFRVASQHYERDLLWSRLLFDYTRGPGPEVARTLALPTDVFRVEVGPQQLEECLRLSICTPLETLDPRLDELLRVSGVCWQELALRLRDIYSDQLREFQFQEDDENSSHLLLLCPDTFDLVIHLCFVTPKNQVDRDAPAEDGGSSGSADSSPDSASMNGSHAGSFNGEFSDDGFDVETQGDVRVEICRREEPPNKQFTFAQRRSITEFVNSIVHWQWRSLIYD